MDFSRFLEQYTKAKQMRGGVMPGRSEAAAIFSPYFEKRQALDAILKELKQKDEAQAALEKHRGESLAWDREKTELDLASRKKIAEGGNASQMAIALANLASRSEISDMDLATRRGISDSDLAFKMWQQGLLKDAAGQADRNSMWGNIFSGLGSLGSGYLLKKYWA